MFIVMIAQPEPISIGAACARPIRLLRTRKIDNRLANRRNRGRKLPSGDAKRRHEHDRLEFRRASVGHIGKRMPDEPFIESNQSRCVPFTRQSSVC